MLVSLQGLRDLRNQVDCWGRLLRPSSTLGDVAWIKTNVQTCYEKLDLSKTDVGNLLECWSSLAVDFTVDGLATVGEGIGDEG